MNANIWGDFQIYIRVPLNTHPNNYIFNVQIFCHIPKCEKTGWQFLDTCLSPTLMNFNHIRFFQFITELNFFQARLENYL